jgi:hypothetical protein
MDEWEGGWVARGELVIQCGAFIDLLRWEWGVSSLRTLPRLELTCLLPA